MSRHRRERRSRRETFGSSYVCRYRESVRVICKQVQILVILQSKIFNIMKTKINNMTWIEWLIVALSFISVCLLVIGFCCPPPGEIHNSVLLAVGELFAFSALLTGLYAIKRGADAKITHGQTTLEITNPDDNEPEPAAGA